MAVTPVPVPKFTLHSSSCSDIHCLLHPFPMSKRTNPPVIDHNKNYTKLEQLFHALSNYHAELQKHIENPEISTKPVILQYANICNVSETTFHQHIKTPSQNTRNDVGQETQILTPGKEEVLVERLLFLDDFDIPASKCQLYNVAYTLLHR